MKNLLNCPICKSGEIKERFYTGIKDPYNCISGEFYFNKCTKCDNLFLGNPFNQKDIAFVYPKNYSKFENKLFNKIRKLLAIRLIDKVLSQVQNRKDFRILEIGAGSGLFSKYFFRKGYKVTATDIDEMEMQALSKIGIDIKIGNFEDLVFEEKYDLIIMSHVIEHFYHPQQIVNKIKGFINDNGQIFIKTPNSTFLFLRWFKNHTYVFDAPRHLNIFSEKSIKILFADPSFVTTVKNEFTVNELYNFFKLKFPRLNYKYYLLFTALLFPFAVIPYLFKRSSRLVVTVKNNEHSS